MNTGRFIDTSARKLVEGDAGAWDERERAIYAEAATFGLTLGILAWWGIAMLLALIGQTAAALVLLFSSAIPALATIWYAARRQVSSLELLGAWSLRWTIGVTALLAVMAAVTVMGVLHSLLNGQGIIHVEFRNEIPAQTDDAPLALIATFGIASAVVSCLLVLGLVWYGHLKHRR